MQAGRVLSFGVPMHIREEREYVSQTHSVRNPCLVVRMYKRGFHKGRS
jgi:hypothetical protein